LTLGRLIIAYSQENDIGTRFDSQVTYEDQGNQFGK
jgi:hypothetical protein